MSDPAWLSQLVTEELERYGMPAPALAPVLRPEVGGRGVILVDLRQAHAGNAETVRLMGPRISESMPAGYMRYTDDAGGYVDPRTGTARFTNAPGSGAGVQSAGDATGADPLNWPWPAAAVGQPSFDGAVEATRQQTIEAVVCDALGWRVVLEVGTLVGTVIRSLTLSDKRLELETSDGSGFRCAVDRDFETWQLVVADRGLWVGLPGGGIAEFDYRRGDVIADDRS